MKKLFIFLLFIVLACGVSSYLPRFQLVCQEAYARGAIAYCPSGFVPTSCACGMGCGSWDVRQNSICHCQCADIDWTTARCCKIS